MEIITGVLFALIIFILVYYDKLIKIRLRIYIKLSIVLAFTVIIIILNDMDTQFVITILTIIGGLASMTLKHHLDNKNTKKTFSVNIKTLVESLRSVENEVVKQGEDNRINNQATNEKIDKIQEFLDFEQSLINSINNESTLIVSINESLEDRHKNIITFISNQIQNLAVKYYKCPFRNNSEQLEPFLKTDIDERTDQILSYIDDKCPELVIIGTKKYTLSKYIIEKKALNRIELLKMKLIDNGLDKQKVKTTFRTFTKKLSSDIIKLIISFNILSKTTAS